MFPEVESRDVVRIFRLGKLGASSRKELRSLWDQYGAAILADWQLKGREGVPWGEQILKGEKVCRVNHEKNSPGADLLFKGF